jgi:hypothetical protein
MTEVALRDDAQAPAVSQSANPMEMMASAIQNGATPEMLEQLMTLQERWQGNQARIAFNEAMAAARAKIGPIMKTQTVDFTSPKGRTNYQHEDLAGIARQVDAVLSEFGLSYRYRTNQEGDRVSVTCVVIHSQGHSEDTTLSANVDGSGNKNHIQAIGSAVTYLQRYTLKAALGLSASKDDDGRNTVTPVSQKTLSEKQLSELRDLLADLGREEGKFVQYLNGQKWTGETLEDMSEDVFTPAKKLLEGFKAKEQSQ